MSLYNAINGFNMACVMIMPMLGRKQDEYPRFRDCFVSEDDTILIFTRVGGGNRGAGYGEEELMKDPLFIKTWDWEEDSTYGLYEFSVPEKWKGDFDKIMSDKPEDVSDEYVSLVMSFYPTLAENGFIAKMFRREPNAAQAENHPVK